MGGDHSPHRLGRGNVSADLRNKEHSNTAAFAVELVAVPAGVVTRTFFQKGLGHRGRRGFMLARCNSVAALPAWPHFCSLLFLTGLILPGWIGALAPALISCVLHYL